MSDRPTVCEITGSPGDVARFVEEIERRATKTLPVASMPGAATLVVWGVRPIALDLEGFSELEVGERALDPAVLFHAIHIEGEPPPPLREAGEVWHDHVLNLVSSELQSFGVEIMAVLSAARDELPIGATAPTPDEGMVVGAIVAATTEPLRLEAAGIVRIDDSGTVRVRSRGSEEWTGPFLGTG